MKAKEKMNSAAPRAATPRKPAKAKRKVGITMDEFRAVTEEFKKKHPEFKTWLGVEE